MADLSIGKIELAAPNFFALRMREVDVEVWPDAERAYFVHQGRVVAVAVLTQKGYSDAR